MKEEVSGSLQTESLRWLISIPASFTRSSRSSRVLGGKEKEMEKMWGVQWGQEQRAWGGRHRAGGGAALDRPPATPVPGREGGKESVCSLGIQTQPRKVRECPSSGSASRDVAQLTPLPPGSESRERREDAGRTPSGVYSTVSAQGPEAQTEASEKDALDHGGTGGGFRGCSGSSLTLNVRRRGSEHWEK